MDTGSIPVASTTQGGFNVLKRLLILLGMFIPGMALLGLIGMFLLSRGICPGGPVLFGYIVGSVGGLVIIVITDRLACKYGWWES